MFIAAPFTTVMITWRQPKCPSRKNWVKKTRDTHMWHMHWNMNSTMKKNETPPFAAL